MTRTSVEMLCVTDIMQNLRMATILQFGHLNKMAKRCDSRCSILSFGIILNICFICINNFLSKSKETWPKLKLNTVYANQANLSNDKILHLKSHISLLIKVTKLLSSYPPIEYLA